MKLPCVSISVDEEKNLVITHQKEGRVNPLSVPIPLKDLNEDGFDLSAQKIGALTLQLLEKWYPEELQEFDRLKTPPT
jgi:hypothetical protein